MAFRQPLRRPVLMALLVASAVASIVAGCLPAAEAKPGGGAGPTAAPAASPVADRPIEQPQDIEALDPASLPPWLFEASAPPAPPTAAPTPLPRPTQSYAINLFATGDFVAQYTFEWCVGASIQMALNMVGKSNNRTRARQG